MRRTNNGDNGCVENKGMGTEATNLPDGFLVIGSNSVM